MRPEDMELTPNESVEYISKRIDPAYVTDPPEIMRLLPSSIRAKLIQETYIFEAQRSEMISQMFQVQAQMLNNKAAIIKEQLR